MSLFYTNQILHSVTENPLKLETPLGQIKFKIIINELPLNFNFLSNVQSTNSHNFLFSTKSKDFEIDCLRVQFIPVLPSHMNVDKCFAFIWRIKALENLNVNLQCLLDTVLVGSPDPGEYLIAQTFENHSINLSIGTEDEDKLVLRANNNDWIPRRFHSTINTDNFCYLDQGLEVNFSLLQEEKIQIQFVIAWVLNKNNAVFTWYAVEQSAIEILNQVGFI